MTYYKQTKDITLTILEHDYNYKIDDHTKNALIFFKARFPNRYFDVNYFDTWVWRFKQGYQTKFMDFESLELYTRLMKDGAL